MISSTGVIKALGQMATHNEGKALAAVVQKIAAGAALSVEAVALVLVAAYERGQAHGASTGYAKGLTDGKELGREELATELAARRRAGEP